MDEPILPHGFQFSQGSLQDYSDCPRRFQLRYALLQPWPALIAEPPDEMEEHVQRGADFHHLVHQHVLGLETTRLGATIHDPVLARWWRAYLDHPPPGLPQTIRRGEVVLGAPVAGYRLVARLDLLAVEPGRRVVVVDWKTPRKRPARSVLANRLQTRVYRYLIVRAGSCYNDGHAVLPEQTAMVYWFGEFDGATEQFAYDAEQYAADGVYLARMISEIASRREEIWPLAADDQQCRFCNYRTLCDRRVKPGLLGNLEDDVEPSLAEIDLEQIAEIAF